MFIVYKPNLTEFLKEASFAVYTFIASETTAHFHEVKIVLSAWDMEDHPIQLHLKVDSALYGNTSGYNKIVEIAKAKLEEINRQIIEAELEVREGIFSTVDRPVVGQLQ
jgi:hypothetical protein